VQQKVRQEWEKQAAQESQLWGEKFA
jgi:hypothetical protein